MNPKHLDSALRVKEGACTTPEEILALAKEERNTPIDIELDQISGGGFCDVSTCPIYGSESIVEGDFPTFMCLHCNGRSILEAGSSLIT